MVFSKKKYAFCSYCNLPVKKPKKKRLESFDYQILIIATISSLGLALLGFIIYRLFFQKRKYCPDCGRVVEFYETRKEMPHPKVPVINLLEKIKDEKSKSVSIETKEEPQSQKEFIQCENCGKTIQCEDCENLICPYCGWQN